MSHASVISRIAHKAYAAAPDMMPRTPWWEHLDPNFHATPESFEMGWRDRSMVGTSAGLDVLIRTAGALAVSALAVPPGYNPLTLYRAFSDAEHYAPPSDGDPDSYFRPPPRAVPIKPVKPAWPHFKPEDGTCQGLIFDSPYMPRNPRQRRSYLRHRRNRKACAQYWRHDDGPRPTIVAIHGFFADPYWLNEWFFALPWFYKMGCDVLLVTLPFHGRRQTKLSPFSGHGLFAGGISRINEAFGQAVCDIRVFLDYLFETVGVEQVGLTGVSLGGYTTALLASIDKRLAFAIPNVPVVSIADLVLEWFPLNWAVGTALRVLRKPLPEIRRMMACHCPLSYPPVLAPERLMIIGGIGDRLAPPKHSRLLWDHWDRCRIHWFPGSHVLHMDKGAYLKHTAQFLSELGFVEPRDGR